MLASIQTMRFRVECRVETQARIDHEFNIGVDDLTYIFTRDSERRIVKLSITAPVADVEKFRTHIIESPQPGVKAHIEHNIDKELFDRLIAEFQRIEAH